MENSRILDGEEKNTPLLYIDQTEDSAKEISEDFSLPDYVDEVCRVVEVRAQALIESSYINESDGKITYEASGSVTYSLFYTSEEGKLCALPLTSSFQIELPLDYIPRHSDITVSAQNPTVRVSAPRKITIKSLVKARACLTKSKEHKEKITPFSSADIIYLQSKTEKIDVLDIDKKTAEALKLSEGLGKIEKEMRPIWCDAKITINDIKAQSKKATVYADITVQCLLTCGEDEELISRSYQVVNELNGENIDAQDMIRASGKTTALSISNEEKESGSELFFDLTYEICAFFMRNKEKTVTLDAYSTKNESTPSYCELEYQSAIKSHRGSFSVNESLKKGNSENEEIVVAFGDPVYEKCEIKSSKLYLLGTLYLSTVAKRENCEENEDKYTNYKYKIPLRYEVGTARANEKIELCASFNLLDLSTRCENDTLYVNAEINASFLICKVDKIKVLDELIIDTGSEIKLNSSQVKAHFVKENEGLWDIAKKHHTTMSHIKEQNDIIDDEEFNKKVILI